MKEEETTYNEGNELKAAALEINDFFLAMQKKYKHNLIFYATSLVIAEAILNVREIYGKSPENSITDCIEAIREALRFLTETKEEI